MSLRRSLRCLQASQVLLKPAWHSLCAASCPPRSQLSYYHHLCGIVSYLVPLLLHKLAGFTAVYFAFRHLLTGELCHHSGYVPLDGLMSMVDVSPFSCWTQKDDTCAMRSWNNCVSPAFQTLACQPDFEALRVYWRRASLLDFLFCQLLSIHALPAFM